MEVENIIQDLFKDLEKRMDGAVSNLQESLSGLRAGRASPSLLENVEVQAYGSNMKIRELATVNAPDSQTLLVSIFDDGTVKVIEKAIIDIGFTPQTEGKVIRVKLPPLTQERRQQMTKNAKDFLEQAKISVRNVRRDGISSIKKHEKNNEISEDDMHKHNDQIQVLTDKKIDRLEALVEKKCSEITES